MTIKKVCFQSAQSSEENMMKCQPAEWCNESAEFDTLDEQNPQDDFCAMSPRKSPTSILLAPKRASPHTLQQNSRRRVSFFVPPYIPPMFHEIQHRNLPGSPRSTERRRALAELAIFECGRMESNCTAPPDQPLTIPVRRFSNDDFVLY
jgi:hypothetical protein